MSISTSRIARTACFAALVVLCASAHAVDGVVLIDQGRALAGNVTPGDAPGFPVTITQPGSYKLAGSLTVPDANTSAIVIQSGVSGVLIDLNGFTIAGPTVCQGFPKTCSPLGTGNGISVGSGSGSSRGITVRNGFITGMGNYGVLLFGDGSTVSDLSIASNGLYGMFVQLGTILNNRVYNNRGIGIAGGNSVIMQNYVSGNGASGISVNDAIVVNNVIVTNTGPGLIASNSAFSGNQFSSNNGGASNPQFVGNNAIGPNGCDGRTCP